MIRIPKINFPQLKSKLQVKSPWDRIIIMLLSILITIPVFIILHQNLIDLNWAFNLDRIFIFIFVLAAIFFVLMYLRTIIIVCVALYLLVLVYGSVLGNYGFNEISEDYNSMIYTMSDNPFPQDIIVAKLLPFPNKSKIINAIEYQDPKVRNFAIMATNEHFKGIKGYSDYRTTIQCFAVFKEINSRWNYVNDPKEGDYIATASESIEYFSGDCDDHSILMAAAIRSIGGTPRLIHTKGHIYPEILIGSMIDLEKINYLIKNVLFVKESSGKKLHYHIDERGQVWLNLDYTAKYPGGPFMFEEILGALTLN
ncbi:transglutaminase [Flavobacterium sp. GA093]|uniref:Transglutaminase n=1 Tax=Flavobacterium hydrocarbonoxydans TaxID=2683249 RepID=A0A6I4NRN0_9FLAO|nr:transglutaminase [Flavobacterium hydrocarbonoxydans]MWB96873.1 transglutaminase [Flavobacterium hydrocarbonoxydans]